MHYFWCVLWSLVWFSSAFADNAKPQKNAVVYTYFLSANGFTDQEVQKVKQYLQAIQSAAPPGFAIEPVAGIEAADFAIVLTRSESEHTGLDSLTSRHIEDPNKAVLMVVLDRVTHTTNPITGVQHERLDAWANFVVVVGQRIYADVFNLLQGDYQFERSKDLPFQQRLNLIQRQKTRTGIALIDRLLSRIDDEKSVRDLKRIRAVQVSLFNTTLDNPTEPLRKAQVLKFQRKVSSSCPAI